MTDPLPEPAPPEPAPPEPVPPQPGATCDRCGPAVRAVYGARRNGELYLCRHCANRFWSALCAQGWTIRPVGEHALAPLPAQHQDQPGRTTVIGSLFDSPWKILIVAVVLIVLFGSKKLPDAARSLGRSMRILKSEVSALHQDDPEIPASDPSPRS